MGFLKNFGTELGTGSGKGIVAIFSAAWKIICIFFAWWAAWKPAEEGKSWPQANSLRIAVTSFIFACFFVPGLVTTHTSGNPQSNFQQPAQQTSTAISVNNNLPQKEMGSTKFYLQLKEGYKLSTFPEKKDFEIRQESDVQMYRDDENTRFLYYQVRSDGKESTILADTDFCAIVPAGRSILFKAKRPPRFAANMKNRVLYVSKEDFFSWYEKIARFISHPWFGENHQYLKYKTWKLLSQEWDHVAMGDNFNMVATALESKDIINNTRGGLVCF